MKKQNTIKYLIIALSSIFITGCVSDVNEMHRRSGLLVEMLMNFMFYSGIILLLFCLIMRVTKKWNNKETIIKMIFSSLLICTPFLVGIDLDYDFFSFLKLIFGFIGLIISMFLISLFFDKISPEIKPKQYLELKRMTKEYPNLKTPINDKRISWADFEKIRSNYNDLVKSDVIEHIDTK